MSSAAQSIPKRILHPVLRDVLISGFTSILISVASLVVVSLIGRLSHPKEVAEYLLLRRVCAWILSGVLLGITMALPRYVAHAVNRPGLQKAYFTAAMTWTILPSVLVASVVCLRSGTFAQLLFGDSQFRSLLLPLALLLVANATHGTVYGFYRGRLQMERANTLQFLNFALFPLLSVVVLWIRGSVASMFAVLALLTMTSSICLAIPVFRERADPQTRWREISAELLRYGVPRIPGDVVLGGLFAILPVIAAHYTPLPKLAALLLGLGVLNVLGTGANPLNQVLLSKISMMLAEDRIAEARRYIQHLLAASIEISSFVCIQAVIFADVGIRIWVGPKYVNDMLLIRMLLLAAPFYLVHTALRCVIDAASVTAYNTRNILMGAGFFVALVVIAVGSFPRSLLLDSVTGAFVVAMIVIGMLTAKTLNHLYAVKVSWKDSGPSLALSGLLGGISFLIRWTQHFETSVIETFLLQFILAVLFLGFLIWRRAPWLHFLRELFLQGRIKKESLNEDLVTVRAA